MTRELEFRRVKIYCGTFWVYTFKPSDLPGEIILNFEIAKFILTGHDDIFVSIYLYPSLLIQSYYLRQNQFDELGLHK